MKYLLDTCVLSETQKPSPDARVRAAVEAIPANDPFVSAITFAELVRGVAGMEAGKRQHRLSEWLHDLQHHAGISIIPVDVEVARRWGELDARTRRGGRPLPVCDGLIAATALCHGLVVVTRNTRDFERTGVVLANPWDDSMA